MRDDQLNLASDYLKRIAETMGIGSAFEEIKSMLINGYFIPSKPLNGDSIPSNPLNGVFIPSSPLNEVFIPSKPYQYTEGKALANVLIRSGLLNKVHDLLKFIEISPTLKSRKSSLLEDFKDSYPRLRYAIQERSSQRFTKENLERILKKIAKENFEIINDPSYQQNLVPPKGIKSKDIKKYSQYFEEKCFKVEEALTKTKKRLTELLAQLPNQDEICELLIHLVKDYDLFTDSGQFFNPNGSYVTDKSYYIVQIAELFHHLSLEDEYRFFFNDFLSTKPHIEISNNFLASGFNHKPFHEAASDSKAVYKEDYLEEFYYDAHAAPQAPKKPLEKAVAKLPTHPRALSPLPQQADRSAQRPLRPAPLPPIASTPQPNPSIQTNQDQKTSARKTSRISAVCNIL